MALAVASGGSQTQYGAEPARCVPRTSAPLDLVRVVASLRARTILDRAFRDPLYFCTEGLIACGLLALAAQVGAGNPTSWHQPRKEP
jgi:hypothetical protein